MRWSPSCRLRPFHTKPKKRIQCASNAHLACSHLYPVLGDAHSVRIESIHLRKWIGTENLLFIHRIAIKITNGYAPHERCRSLHLGHYTRCICCPRYELRWPIMLGCYWLDAVNKETAYTKWSRVVQRNSCSTSSTTSDKVRQVIGWTSVCVSIHLECWLDIEITTWAAVGVAHLQQFGYNLVSKF